MHDYQYGSCRRLIPSFWTSITSIFWYLKLIYRWHQIKPVPKFSHDSADAFPFYAVFCESSPVCPSSCPLSTILSTLKSTLKKKMLQIFIFFKSGFIWNLGTQHTVITIFFWGGGLGGNVILSFYFLLFFYLKEFWSETLLMCSYGFKHNN